MKGKKRVWASYGDPKDTVQNEVLTKETAQAYASSLLGHIVSDFTGNGLEAQQYKIFAVQVVEDAQDKNVGYILVDMAEIPEIVTDKTWGGLDVMRTWEPRTTPAHTVDIVQNGVRAHFEVKDEEDADVLLHALIRVQSMTVIVDELI